MPDSLLNLLPVVLMGLAVAGGVLLGAWVNFRSRTSQSPIPSLPRLFAKHADNADEIPPTLKLPQAKVGSMSK